jgi:acyl-CoA synthetase (AMP-forming)/AMP-acid ligase II
LEAVERVAANIGPLIDSNNQEVITVLLPNSIDFIVAYMAIIETGHIALPLDPAYKSLEFDNLIEQIPPKLIISNAEYRTKFSETHQKDVRLLEDIRNKTSKEYKPLRLDPKKQIASLTFTSGTTGKPKAVPNTHANHIWNIKVCSERWDWSTKDTLLVSVPLSHMHGIVIGLSGSIYHGNTIYLQKWFDETETLQLLASGNISILTHAASAYVKLIQAADDNYDLSAVRLCISGAAPLPPAIWQKFKQRYGVEILETYGTSETGRIAGNRLHERLLGSPGKPFSGVDLRLSKEDEVLIKSGGVFPGYFKNAEATKASLTKDGYWRTGDLAELKDGYLFIKGRLQERIRRFGYTISPRDVEWALLKNPGIKDIFVLGRQVTGQPDDEIIYFLVTELDDEAITAYCKQNLLFAWRPDKVIHLNELPKTRSGKVKMMELKELIDE